MLRRRNAFTLIELLVVIAIIAILAAILFPVFARAKANAKMTNCLNNLKQYGTAMNMYIDSSNGRFPWAGSSLSCAHDARRKPLGIGGYKTCADALQPYTKNRAMRWCPEWPANYRSDTDWSYWYYCPHAGTDLEGNQWVARYNKGKGALCGFSTSDVRYPSRKPALCEVSSRHQRFDGNSVNYLYPIVYCDGHTKAHVIASDVDPRLVEVLYIGRDGTYTP